MKELILAVEQRRIDEAKTWKLPLAHIAYKIGQGGRLLRYRFPEPPQGGVMVVDGAELSPSVPVEMLCGEIVRECAVRRFQGVLWQFPRHKKEWAVPVLRRLEGLCGEHGLSLYVPESCGGVVGANVLLPTALSGGSYRERVGETAGRFGAERVALWVERVCEDFLLPSPTGAGRILTREELEKLRMEQGSAVFFSHDLCARYFTYRDGERGHFVLFDDAGSLRQKLAVAGELGVQSAFLPYEDVKDILSNLLE